MVSVGEGEDRTNERGALTCTHPTRKADLVGSGHSKGSSARCSVTTSTGRGDWKAKVLGVAKSQTRLSDFTVTFQVTLL